MRRLWALALGMALCAAAAAAQSGATINGRVVHKVSNGGIAGVEVRLAPGAHRLFTDADGYFRVQQVAAGTLSLRVRHIGFRPESAFFAIAANEDLELLIELEEAPRQLDTVTVAGREDMARGKLAGFYERKKSGIGHFFEPDVLSKNEHRRLGDLITANTTGSRLVRSLTGTMAWVATTRRFGTSLIPGRSNVDEYDLNRGADPRACYPDVYLDGGVVYSFGRGASLFDINSIPNGGRVGSRVLSRSLSDPTAVQQNERGLRCTFDLDEVARP